MQQFIPTLGFMALLIGLVSAVDRVMDKDAKKLLGHSIKNLITGRKYDVAAVNNPIGFIERIKPFSLKSALVSGAFSVASFIMVIYIQYFALNYDFSETVSGVSRDHINTYVSFIVYMIAANIIVDYLSFTQTLVIIRLINKTDSKGSLIVLLFTDFLASINIFTFAYAFFLVVGVTTLLNFHERTHILVSIEESKPSPQISEMMKSLEFSNPERYKSVSVLRVLDAEGKPFSGLATAYILAVKPVGPPQVFPLINSILKSEFPASAVSLHQESGTLTPYDEFPDTKVEYSFRGEIEFDLSPLTYWSQWFSAAYLLTDDVQDNFFAVAGLSPGFQKIDSLRNDANRRASELSLRDIVVSWCPSDQTARDKNDTTCEDGFVLLSSNIPALSATLAGAAVIGGKLPLYTFFFTSLSLTFVIYMFYLSIYILRMLWLAAGRFSTPLVRFANFEEHPVTIVSLPLILLSGLLYFALTL